MAKKANENGTVDILAMAMHKVSSEAVAEGRELVRKDISEESKRRGARLDCVGRRPAIPA